MLPPPFPPRLNAFYGTFLYADGVIPANLLKAVLKVALELKPLSKAMPCMVILLNPGSLNRRLASSTR